MKWLWTILLPLSLDAQCLKPGIYRDLRPVEPIVLDTGTFTFIGLQMSDLGQCIWLNAGQARKVELKHCTFEGKDEGIAVLSSGDLTVSHCTFAQMDDGILQASPPGSKREVTITNCVFRDDLTSIRLEKGKQNGLTQRGLVSSVLATGNTFQKLRIGMRMNTNAFATNSYSSAYTLKGNIFKDNLTAIDLVKTGTGTGNADVNFTLQCNNFEQTTAITGPDRVGLRIGVGVSIPGNRIGGNNSTSFPEDPNSNYWPRVGTLLSALSEFPGYTSILNESTNQIDYWAYENEYVGKLVPDGLTSPSRLRRLELSLTYTVTDNNIIQWCGAHYTDPDCDYASTTECEANLLGNSACTGGLTWVKACTEGGAFDNISFPVERPVPVDTTHKALVASQEQTYGKQPYLGQSIPNPAYQKVAIPIFLPSTFSGGILEITEMATGRVIHSLRLGRNGIQMQEINVHTWPAGVYSYQLLLNSVEKPLPTLKMVVIH